jgi:hypothetical protein
MAGAAGAGAAVAGAGGACAGRAVAVRADHLTPLHSHTVHLLFYTGRQRFIIISVKKQVPNAIEGRKGTLRPDFQANTRPRIFFKKTNVTIRYRKTVIRKSKYS